MLEREYSISTQVLLNTVLLGGCNNPTTCDSLIHNYVSFVPRLQDLPINVMFIYDNDSLMIGLVHVLDMMTGQRLPLHLEVMLC